MGFEWLKKFQADTFCLEMNNTGVPLEEINETEQILGIHLPPSYKTFLTAWNGADDFAGCEIFSIQVLRNAAERYGFKPFNGQNRLVGRSFGFIHANRPAHLLPFLRPHLSSDLYCFDTRGAAKSDYPVFIYNHETSVAQRAYPSFEALILEISLQLTRDLEYFIDPENEDRQDDLEVAAAVCRKTWEDRLRLMLGEYGADMSDPWWPNWQTGWQSPLADHLKNVQDSYNAVAEEYARRFFNELNNKPLDRQLLNRFVQRVGGRGPVCDMGCGPGEIARYLYDQGIQQVMGVDLAPEMIAIAARLSPQISFQQGSMLSLDVPDQRWAGITAFYSIIHIPPSDLPHALGEMYRVLSPDGLLLLGFHMGCHHVHLDQYYEIPVSLDTWFYQGEEMQEYLKAAGFEVEETIQRGPYEGEYSSQRVYIFARKVG